MNNYAVAAQYLSKRGARIAILDVDVYHGNGSQEIFFERDDILMISLHTDPARFYPFFWGQTNEVGLGRGYGFNLNLQLARKTGDKDYPSVLWVGLDYIHSFGADIIVVALGLDAGISDPFEGLAITTEGFGRIATNIAKLRKPLAIPSAVDARLFSGCCCRRRPAYFLQRHRIYGASHHSCTWPHERFIYSAFVHFTFLRTRRKKEM